MKKILFALAFALAACSDEPVSPTSGVTIAPVGLQARAFPGFFMAFSWPGNAYTSPIPTQPYDASQCPENPNAPCLNDAVYRQMWNDLLDWKAVADWAATHPGHLYILGDGLHTSGGMAGRYKDDPALLATEYCTFVRQVRAVDPTSDFTPGLIEPWVKEPWLEAFAAALLAVTQAGNCTSRPLVEWEFNHYPRWSEGVAGFQAYVEKRVAWAMSLPAPIAAPVYWSAWTVSYGGSFGTDDVPDDDPRYLARLRELKAYLFGRENIVGARALTFEPWVPEHPDPHPLTDKDGKLNATGLVYAEVTGRIAGPKVVSSLSSCSYVAETTGGPAPYTFKWLANGVEVSTQPAIAVVKPDAPFALELIVTDATGGWSSAKLDVSVSAGEPPCS
jgi:hypothetical protein